MNFNKILAGAVPPGQGQGTLKEKVVKAMPKGGKSNFPKKKQIMGFFGKK